MKNKQKSTYNIIAITIIITSLFFQSCSTSNDNLPQDESLGINKTPIIDENVQTDTEVEIPDIILVTEQKLPAFTTDIIVQESIIPDLEIKDLYADDPEKAEQYVMVVTSVYSTLASNGWIINLDLAIKVDRPESEIREIAEVISWNMPEYERLSPDQLIERSKTQIELVKIRDIPNALYEGKITMDLLIKAQEYGILTAESVSEIQNDIANIRIINDARDRLKDYLLVNSETGMLELNLTQVVNASIDISVIKNAGFDINQDTYDEVLSRIGGE